MFNEHLFDENNPADDKDEAIKRTIGDVLNEIRGHLTKEELLIISLFKNSKRQSNNIQRVFLQKYYGKQLSSSSITMRKKRMLQVLYHVTNLIKFKKDNNADLEIKKFLTKHQYQILSLYEKRILLKDIQTITNTKRRAISHCYKIALRRLEESNSKIIEKYLTLLRNVLKYSRKSKFSYEKENC